MPVSIPRSGVFALAASLLAITNVGVNALPPQARNDMYAAGFGYLVNRDCAQFCGYNNQYCCASNQVCFTSGTIAGCSATAGGGYALYTTTWTQTETFTSTVSSWFPASTAANNQPCVPPPGSGWIACGTICCASNQYCAWQGQCLPNGVAGGGGSGGGGGGAATYTSGGQVYTTQYSAPQKVTSGGPTQTSGSGVLGGATTSPTTSGTVTPGGTANSLSPGAIAGIVIGVLAGIVILLLICACCIVRGLWHGLLGLLGLRRRDKRKSRETVIEEERYSRHGSVHSRRDQHTGWFGGGGRPSAAGSRREKEKKSGGGWGWLGVAGAVGTILLLLGLRRDRKKKERQSKARSDYSSTYYSDSYTASSPSSLSSDRRTRDSRRTRRSEGTRISRAQSRRERS